MNMLLFKTYLFIARGNMSKNNKFKIIVPTWNDKFELPDGSYYVTDIQDYIEYIIKKQETSTTVPPILVYINRINNRLVHKIKDGYKLELQAPETMKLFSITQKLIDKTEEGENIPSLEAFEIA